MTPDELEKVLLARKRRGFTVPWWFAGVVMLGFLLLGAAMVKLVFEIGDLQASNDNRSGQISDLGRKVDVLTGQVAADRRQKAYDDSVIAAKDARNRQLEDVLIRRGIPVPAPTVIITENPPAPSPSPAPSPHPTSTPTPRPSRTPAPTPSPTCTRLVTFLC